jgi:hypothetical protein
MHIYAKTEIQRIDVEIKPPPCLEYKISEGGKGAVEIAPFSSSTLRL